MNNTFEIIGKYKTAPTQQNIDGKIVKRKAGRPRKGRTGKVWH